jgi:predicted ATP-grasp superfamily ATP-dependent carboligase
MLVFIYEWSCCVPGAAPSLRREGWAMLWAVLDDFQRTRQIDTITLVHESFPHLPPGQVRRCRDEVEEEAWFGDLAGAADATLVIAPETDNILDARCRWVEDAGGRLLGPAGEGRRLAGSKSLLASLWQRRSVPTPPVLACGQEIAALHSFPVVLKLDDGAGSQATFLVHNVADLQKALREAAVANCADTLIAQRFVPGQPASVAFLVGPRACIPLVPAAQHLSQDGRFRYLGGSMPLPSPLERRATRLARQAIVCCTGLRGFVGVDVVLGAAAEGSEDVAIEINPRLTTSYIGLRALTRDNLALALLQVALGQEPVKLRWKEQAVRFHSDGGVEINPVPR